MDVVYRSRRNEIGSRPRPAEVRGRALRTGLRRTFDILSAAETVIQRKQVSSRVGSYSVAVFAVGVGIALPLVSKPFIGQSAPYVSFIPAVLLRLLAGPRCFFCARFSLLPAFWWPLRWLSAGYSLHGKIDTVGQESSARLCSWLPRSRFAW